MGDDRSSLPPDLRIRPAAAMDRRAWRMLLPDVAAAADPCDVLVAVAALPGAADPTVRVVGAAAATRSQILTPRRGPRVCVHVIPPLRSRGIGGALVAAMEDAQRPRGAEVLFAWSLLTPTDTRAAAWDRLGFRGRSVLLEHELDVETIATRLGPVYEQLVRAGRVPADAGAIGLADADEAAFAHVAELYVGQLGGTPAAVRARLAARGPAGYDGELSVVVMRGARPVGFLLTRPMSADVSMVEAVVVDPAHRGRWANVMAKLESARRGIARGFKGIRFQTFDHNRETRTFTEKLGARLVGETVQLFRTIGA